MTMCRNPYVSNMVYHLLVQLTVSLHTVCTACVMSPTCYLVSPVYTPRYTPIWGVRAMPVGTQPVDSIGVYRGIPLILGVFGVYLDMLLWWCVEVYMVVVSMYCSDMSVCVSGISDAQCMLVVSSWCASLIWCVGVCVHVHVVVWCVSLTWCMWSSWCVTLAAPCTPHMRGWPCTTCIQGRQSLLPTLYVRYVGMPPYGVHRVPWYMGCV